MFLLKGNGIDNPDCYGVVGAGQGIYRIEKDCSSSEVLKPQAIENKEILKELSGKYEDVKNKFK